MKTFVTAAFVLAAGLVKGETNHTDIARVNGNATAGIQYICYPEGRWQDQEFWQHEKGHEPFFCTTFRESSGKPWAMLNSYRSGGKEGVHWKYTSDPNDIGCLLDWTYHSKDGNTVIERVKGRTTLAGDTKRWCGLPVYRSDGVRGKQWDFCSQC